MADLFGMGEKIEDYQVLNLLGKGGFACVYRAISNKTGQEVGIKMIDKKLMKAAGMVARVKKEVEIHSRLKHPSILELYNYFEDSHYVYLVLELGHNGELHRYLKNNCKVLTEDEARHFMKQIVQGLLYLHSHGILHRDLTLANLLLTRDMNVKIADFGLATQLSVPDEKHFTMCGTPNYISPEVAMRTAHGLEADVWSLGCMLYTFLVGKPPFDTDAVKSTLNRVISAEYELPDHLSPEAKDLIQSLLKKNPKERLSLGGFMDHPFMTKEVDFKNNSNQHSVEASMDSGRGTMATTTSSSRVTTYSKPQPVMAFPFKDWQNQLPVKKDTDHTGSSNGSCEFNVFHKRVKPPSPHTHRTGRQPPSPPVRLRDSETTELKRHISRSTGQLHKEGLTDPTQPRSQAPHRCFQRRPASADYRLRKPSVDATHAQPTHAAEFDPSKYQDGSHTPSSSGWSCGSYQSGHHHMRTSPAHRAASDTSSSKHYSGVSSQDSDEYCLEPTKRVLQFNPELSPPMRDCHQNHWSQRSDSAPSESGSISSHGEFTHTHPHAANHHYPDTRHNLYQQAFQHQTSVDDTRSQSDTSKGSDTLSASESNPQFLQTWPRSTEACGQFNPNHWQTQNRSPTKTCQSLHENSAVKEVQEVRQAQAACVSSGIRKVVSPVESVRLRPIRQRTRNAIVNIMENGEICLEFLRVKDKEERVIEVFHISSDGLQVAVFQPGSSRGVVVGDKPIPVSPNCKRFTFDNLPQKYWKKYQYAARFVSLVKSKTPKVTLYTKRAKCMLMENTPDADFEAVFYDGAKVSANSKHIRIIEKTGTSLVLESEQNQQHLTENTKSMLDYVKKCQKQCTDLEAVLTTTQAHCVLKEQMFPIIIGRRPSSVSLSPTKTGCSVPQSSPTVVTSPNPPTMSSFDGTVLSAASCRTAGQSSVSSQSSQASKRDLTRQVYVNNIGWAVQQPNGEIWVRFNDGTQIGVKSSVTCIKYVDQQGNLHRFQETDMLPETVKRKLEKLPVVLEHLLSVGAIRNSSQ
ncbi:serine/threonine-protein kinase PLK4-like [Liolophura sinensis]|uniref:serine/threonine-protein kinase PLK4-like n=1 Tax=Liolophura sinensis TaxID=3198878 RepID=UPI0031581CB0